MNDRILELYNLSGINKEGTGVDSRKFAELIIRECIGIVNPTQHHEMWAQSYLGGVDGLDLLYGKVKAIKEHFGVEE